RIARQNRGIDLVEQRRESRLGLVRSAEIACREPEGLGERAPDLGSLREVEAAQRGALGAGRIAALQAGARDALEHRCPELGWGHPFRSAARYALGASRLSESQQGVGREQAGARRELRSRAGAQTTSGRAQR